MNQNLNVELGQPLEKLMEVLRREFPADPSKSAVDRFQKLDGSFDKTLHESQLFFLARRMVTLAKYSCKMSPSSNEAQVIRDCMESVFDLTILSNSTQVINLVHECYQSGERRPNRSQRRNFKKETGDTPNCYICGSSLDLKNGEGDKEITLEHVLPREFGGGNVASNFKPACKKCNGFKRNRFGGADLHYESLVYPYVEEEESRIGDYQKFASSLFGESKCSICGGDRQELGEMNLMLSSPSDCWHLFNVVSVCDKCKS